MHAGSKGFKTADIVEKAAAAGIADWRADRCVLVDADLALLTTCCLSLRCAAQYNVNAEKGIHRCEQSALAGVACSECACSVCRQEQAQLPQQRYEQGAFLRERWHLSLCIACLPGGDRSWRRRRCGCSLASGLPVIQCHTFGVLSSSTCPFASRGILMHHMLSSACAHSASACVLIPAVYCVQFSSLRLTCSCRARKGGCLGGTGRGRSSGDGAGASRFAACSGSGNVSTSAGCAPCADGLDFAGSHSADIAATCSVHVINAAATTGRHEPWLARPGPGLCRS